MSGEQVQTRDYFHFHKNHVWIVRNKNMWMPMTDRNGVLKKYRPFSDTAINTVIKQYLSPDMFKDEESLSRKLAELKFFLQSTQSHFEELITIKDSSSKEYRCMMMRHYRVRVKKWVIRQYELCITDRANGFEM